jgi:hypothetical protein
MPEQISISKTLSLRECGLNEYWLQDQIAGDPSMLGLGDLEVVRREKQQSSGGKLDILLKDPEDDTMYEVEVMLGATDESHIIRTIEYWDLERKRWPQRQHFAVLVAENITRRFFNVIQLFSLSIPIVAIQANVIEANGARILHFAKILDTYEEPEDEASATGETYDEAWWKNRSTSNLETAKAFLKVVSSVYGRMELVYNKYYIAVKIENSFFNQFFLKPRSGNKSLLGFWVNNTDLEQVSAAFDQKGLPFTHKKTSKGATQLVLTIDQKLVEANGDLWLRVAEFVKQC